MNAFTKTIFEEFLKLYPQYKKYMIKIKIDNEIVFDENDNFDTFNLPGNKYVEFMWFRNEDSFYDYAYDYLSTQIQTGELPITYFNKSFIISNINDAILKNRVYDNVYEKIFDDPEYFTEYLDDYDEKNPPKEFTDEMIESMVDNYMSAYKSTEDLYTYFEDIFDDENLSKFLIDNNIISINDFVEEAIDTDGPAHFIQASSNNYDISEKGFVFIRTN